MVDGRTETVATEVGRDTKSAFPPCIVAVTKSFAAAKRWEVVPRCTVAEAEWVAAADSSKVVPG